MTEMESLCIYAGQWQVGHFASGGSAELLRLQVVIDGGTSRAALYGSCQAGCGLTQVVTHASFPCIQLPFRGSISISCLA
jgi:hypothetical protein